MKDINQIINNFLDGNTTKEEEFFLKEFLFKYDTTNEYSYLKDLFEYYENENQIKAPIDFDEVLIEKINENELKKKKISRLLNYAISGIAATFIIFIGVFYYFNKSNSINSSDELNQTYFRDDKLNTTQQAFSLMNYYINKGLSPIQEIEKLNSASEEVIKFEMFYEYKSKVFKNY
ncbi:MAG TPA: hypothetical protein PK762_09375 [Candidatus Kapabacteria bacterium]|mgnify:CR=1 FL=1|nr:hypothetical protein [Candidatus Kapabacteria bacterium]